MRLSAGQPGSFRSPLLESSGCPGAQEHGWSQKAQERHWARVPLDTWVRGCQSPLHCVPAPATCPPRWAGQHAVRGAPHGMPEPAHRGGTPVPHREDTAQFNGSGRPTGTPLPWCHLVNKGQVPLDGGLVVLPLLPQLPAQFLLRLLDPPDGEVSLLRLHGVGTGKQKARPAQGAVPAGHTSVATWDRGGDRQ